MSETISGFIMLGWSKIFVLILKNVSTLAYLNSILRSYGSTWPLFLFLNKAAVPVMAIRDPFLFLIIFPNYLNLLCMTMFHVT
jgi:hypothetical protein